MNKGEARYVQYKRLNVLYFPAALAVAKPLPLGFAKVVIVFHGSILSAGRKA